MFASALASAALTLSVLSAPGTATEPEPGSVDDPGSAAIEALAEVRDLVDGATALPPGAEPAADLTLALRDLALLKAELPRSLQPRATGYLARPTDGDGDPYGDGYAVPEEEPACSEVVCVHYVTTTGDQVPAGDGDDNGVPDFVDLTLETMTHVHGAYVAAGYRAPESDLAADNNGGDARPDIYLADVGRNGYYGYCASDEDLRPNQPQTTWGFCVLDNDYRRGQFPSNTPTQNLQVTAAHEYFHAVQFGYDISEDGWVMEATATWAEDELYDAVDDNVQYLRYGPMRRSEESMDQFTGLFHYGTWSFFRYLTEQFPYAQGGLPIVVRDLWRRLDSATGAPNDYSLQGVTQLLRRRGLSLTDAFAGYAAANRMPDRHYDESRANNYPHAPLVSTTWLTPSRRSTDRTRLALDHLAAGTLRYRPGRRLAAADWKLRVILDLDRRWKGTAAVVTIKPRNGAPRTKRVSLDKFGDANPRFGFSSNRVKFIEVTLVNASDDFQCDRGTNFSCAGRPKFDGSVQQIRARAFRP